MIFMFVMLLLNLTCSYGINLSTLAFIGHLGTDNLAAAALGTSIVGMLGRTVLYGLVGGLDTLASQAYGAGNITAMGGHFRVATMFLLLHLLPLLALLGALPLVLQREETEHDLGFMAGRYVRLMLPSLIFECFNRPLNSVLVAQRITAPQMAIQIIALALHISTNYVLIHVLGLGYLGGAMATTCTAAYVLLMTSTYVLCSGLGPRVWGGPGLQVATWTALRSFAHLSYPACIMKCAESWGFSFMTVAAGKLPHPETAVSAASISFNIYGVLFMCFSAFAVTTCTQVGNALGAGSARSARHAALTSLCTAPVIWVGIATLLIEPHTQLLLTQIFTDGHDASLMYHLRRMLVLVAALELFDGSQVVMTGVIQGAGKQRLGVMVNVLAFYVVAIPTALIFAFVLHWGVEGMYSGMLLGPFIQAVAYSAIILKLNWQDEARKVATRSAAIHRNRNQDGEESSS
ncbi:hypothetical protein Vafri_3721 [Volvox africanus]|uniref:Protein DETOXIFICATION n=3 Tax=Volvox africanus TaxID=51714 RepID=A0A8J4AW35_9CHLO|nr:hypothetical protein Vafri_3721 [Volvox africanus]